MGGVLLLCREAVGVFYRPVESRHTGIDFETLIDRYWQALWRIDRQIDRYVSTEMETKTYPQKVNWHNGTEESKKRFKVKKSLSKDEKN